MRIDRVSYHLLSNLGNYENERIELSAELEEGEDPVAAKEKLKALVLSMASESSQVLDKQRWKLRDQIEELERKLKKAQENWNATAEFLRTQGLKPDAPNAPIFINLLPESTEVVEPEHVDADVENNDEDNSPF